MNAAHLHLILNHFPVVTFIIAFLVVLAGMGLRNTSLLRTALALMILAGLGGLAAYLTGEPAEDMLKKAQWFSKQAVHRHEEAAEKAFIVGLVTALLASGALVTSLKGLRHRGKLMALSILGCAISAGLMGWTAFEGGAIRHDEITSDGVIALPDSGIILPGE